MKCISLHVLFIIVIFHYGCANKKTNVKYFTGTVSYTYSYSSDSLDTDSLTAARPVKGVFRYDTAHYQSRFLGRDTHTYYYDGNSNKAVTESGSELSCEEYDIATDSVVSFKLYDAPEKVLGYECRVLELQKNRSWVRYYVSKELMIGPSTYRRHRAYNWDVYGEKAEGGLILKLEHRFGKFTMHGIATEVNRNDAGFKALEISDQEFARICK